MSKSGNVWLSHSRATDDCIVGYLPASVAALYLVDSLIGSGESTGVVVDAGCGDGSDTVALLRAGFTVVSVDILERAIKRRVLEEAGETDRWEFVRADLAHGIPLRTDSVRAVLDVAVLPRIAQDGDTEEAATYLRDVYRVLRPDGQYVVEYHEPIAVLREHLGTLFSVAGQREEQRDTGQYVRAEWKSRVPSHAKSIVAICRPLPEATLAPTGDGHRDA